MNSAHELTYLGIWLAVLANQLCLPVPAILFLMTAGALASHGRLHVSVILLAGVLGCLIADGFWFWLGRRWGSKIVGLVCRLSGDPRQCTQRAHRVFGRWGLRVLVIAKFVPGLDGVTPPLAGSEGSPVLSFLAHDAVGSFLWSAVYTALGFIFADQLDIAVHAAGRFATIAAVCIGVPLLLYIGWRAILLVRTMLHLRLRRMSPALLSRKLDAGRKIAIIDLLNFEEGDDDAQGIPGSVRVDPILLRTGPAVYVPDDVEMVLYCSSQRELTSAQVALQLYRRGIRKLWVLDGGLDAWRKLGLPVTRDLSTPEDAATRLGIRLPPRGPNREHEVTE